MKLTQDHGYFQLQQLVSDLTQIKRNHQHPSKEHYENDVEHSFSVALLCWYIISSNGLKLDIALVLKYAMAHDFVERYAGDVNTFASDDARKHKIETERIALQKLTLEFSDFPEMVDSMTNYEARSDDESLFVWTVDKMQALILGDLDNWRPYQRLDISFQQFSDKYTELSAVSSPYCKQIFESLIAYSKSTYYDRPKD